ncbi:MAG: heparan-alpha-glucosaminide N-acetyltransferase domain-containing protein [Bacteroidota bacterium]
MENFKKHRIESIDLLRGTVMIIMALDHVRDYIGYGSWFSDPTNLETTTPLLFFTRWITHFCAPVFVFLAGTSAFLYGARQRTTKEVSWFLLTRGIWLIFVELVIVNFAWTFDITLSNHILQVIWAIGISMVLLAGIIFLPRPVILSIGIILVAGHNLLDSIILDGTSVGALLWYALHQSKVVIFDSNSAINFAYPLIPWIGLMTLGYIFGTLYHQEFDAGKRKKWLLWMGIAAVLSFVILRTFNIYGESSHWSTQKSGIFTILSFLNTTKYPPSLLFLLMTIGPAFFFLYTMENVRNKISGAVIIFGRVPFFFYVIHIYLAHLFGILGLIYAGRNWSDYIMTGEFFGNETLSNFGFNLYVVYLIWILVIIIMFPLCKWYNTYKTNNRNKWWLSYL